ncbi:unnamed protein product [Heligmosomoides polygyrus]|uniref:Uncharacterized protein n=1 Tax=Heligmosomoides polygyrus TaxID=6339 RepID=A0A183FPK6_HELPZ|nr:unnamed protein product [Heligmosomoides polygyrus]
MRLPPSAPPPFETGFASHGESDDEEELDDVAQPQRGNGRGVPAEKNCIAAVSRRGDSATESRTSVSEWVGVTQ